ncbi:GNAT family N-acetyltransferase [Alteribacter populi]|uniref:GNAT family N-acetyltransferase n=1 Tax=Alteribacter populi TaxID=2011011 RepID=UPI000BBA67CD|nr:GNAT family N-acetyltransferase [Alteribacter populi]
MIKKINLQDDCLASILYNLQRKAYTVEADILKYDGLPPLKESLRKFKNCGEAVIGYFQNQTVLGFLSYERSGKDLTICRLVVSPEHFRKGIAQQLLAHMDCAESNVTSIYVATGRGNDPACLLYEKNGNQWVRDEEVEKGVFIRKFRKLIAEKNELEETTPSKKEFTH